MSSSRAVVAVPVYKPTLTRDEQISWRHLEHFLGDWDVRLFLPEALESPLPSVPAERFPSRYFESVSTYSQLLLSEDFYRRFEGWEYLLVYQLDALVLSHELEPWCNRGYDYLGTPWWKDPQRPDLGLSHAGNGGLSLRRVESALRVLTTPKDRQPSWLRNAFGEAPPDLWSLRPFPRWRRFAGILREVGAGVARYTEQYSVNEDRFWADRARLFDPSFVVAPPEEALAFAFEVAPAAAFERNHQRLPFGCHGWATYGRDFWEPFLLPTESASTTPAPPSFQSRLPAEETALADQPPALPPPPAGRTGWPWDVPACSLPPGDGPSPGKEWPLLSIVVPSFNQGEFLEETLRSILLQGYPRLELLVRDGGSRDSTLDVLRRYDPWITEWVSEPDGGQSDAINTGFSRATGDLLTFFSSDDVYAPGAFFEIAHCWASHPGCGAVVGAFRPMDAQSRLVAEPIPPRLPHAGPFDLAVIHPGAWRLHQVATVYDRRALDAVGRHVLGELRYTMDRELLFRVARHRPVVITEAWVASFRRHPASKSESQVFPFSQEMAELYLRDLPVDAPPAHRRLRLRYARYWRGRAYLKRARVTAPSLKAVLSLFGALRYLPYLPSLRGYAVHWLEALGLENLGRAALGKRRAAASASPESSPARRD